MHTAQILAGPVQEIALIFSLQELRILSDILICARAETAREMSQYREDRAALRDHVRRELELMNSFLSIIEETCGEICHASNGPHG